MELTILTLALIDRERYLIARALRAYADALDDAPEAWAEAADARALAASITLTPPLPSGSTYTRPARLEAP